MDSLSDRFRANVRRTMNRQGLTYEAMAERMDVHFTTIGKTLRPQRSGRPHGYRLETVEAWATALGVDPLELLAEPAQLERAS